MDGGSNTAVSCSVPKEPVNHRAESDTSEKDKPKPNIGLYPAMLLQFAARLQSMLIDLQNSRTQLAVEM